MIDRRQVALSVRPFLLAATILGTTICSRAQAPASTIELKMNPMAVLRDFEPAANEEYELGRGDEITVEVNNRPDLSAKHIIGPDGRITLPLVGDVVLADKTRKEAATIIKEALDSQNFISSVSVGVDHYTSNRILLLGAVEHPGLMLFDNTPTLLEVISRGGIPLQPSAGTAGGSTPIISSGASMRPLVVPEICMIYRGNRTMVTVQLRSLLKEGNPLADMRLKRDDVVFVPGEERFVSVLGQVSRPGTLRLDGSSTLPQLLAEAGGLSEKSGQYPDIQIIHRATDNTLGKTVKISYKAVLDSKPIDLTLQSGDIIFVPESGFNKASDVFQKVSPLVNLVTVGALLR